MAELVRDKQYDKLKQHFARNDIRVTTPSMLARQAYVMNLYALVPADFKRLWDDIGQPVEEDGFDKLVDIDAEAIDILRQEFDKVDGVVGFVLDGGDLTQFKGIGPARAEDIHNAVIDMFERGDVGLGDEDIQATLARLRGEE